MATKLRALYGEDDAKQLLAAAKCAGFAGSTRSGSAVKVGGFNKGNGPDELKAWRELKSIFPSLHVEVAEIDRSAFDAKDRRARLHDALDAVMDGARAKDGQWSIPPEALTKSTRQILDLWKRGKDMHAIGRETGYGFEFVRQVLRDQGVA